MIEYLEITEHLGFAEGSSDSHPSKIDIENAIRFRGYEPYNIKIEFDELQKMWRFNARVNAIGESDEAQE